MTLPEELEYDLETLSEHWPQAEMRIRAELLRLARENAELHKSAMDGYEDGWHALRNERDALRTELAKLKARIAEAPIIHAEKTWRGALFVSLPQHDVDLLDGKRVRLLVDDATEGS